MRAILPAWTDADADLYARLGEMIDPDRRVLAALERIVPLSGKRIADVGTGIGHYPILLARRTSGSWVWPVTMPRSMPAAAKWPRYSSRLRSSEKSSWPSTKTSP